MVLKTKKKWSSAFWYDLGERAGASFLGGVLTLLAIQSLTDLTSALVWATLGVPTATSLVKGLLANLANDSGPSASAVSVDSYTWHPNMKD